MFTKPAPPSKSDGIIIVGAGIFGLSTAIHLAERGYTNVTLLDKNPYESTLYSYLNGCDAASADINKIIRSAYGTQTIYQNLSLHAVEAWDAWNQELRDGGAAVPPGMSSEDVLWINNGDLSVTDADVLPEFESSSIKNMEKAGYADTQLVNNNEAHLRLAEEKGFSARMNPFYKKLLGVMDTTGGIALADKACRFALHKAKRLGVHLFLDSNAGNVLSTIQSPTGKVVGVRTADGKIHNAALVIVACGGWTPSLVPSLDGMAETTAGSVVIFKIPESSPLRQRFAPDNFPAWAFKIGDGPEAGLYGFPVDEHGLLKIGYRGTKYTNPRVQPDGQERSVPITRWSQDEQIRQIPAQAVKVIRMFTNVYLPELADLDIWLTRLCWYTDSFDNQYIIDHVPGQEGLMVVTAGSGHAFKFLPTIGGWSWQWRSLKEGEAPFNKLMEGSKGKRALRYVSML
ncbi:FAD dependent oxidoreductase [Aaosphaeria arxii CBS 175.79]|uniref:FAD dependent oxidoreductase n=1 Tax=Aaosphaeria arxii CBS 175.79 TaxID=1450172 RepID=A0A6A5XB27_9PLEO|nr:FAD dependent oxidoreductase [Aaosphaeria arxii CBS 175.79]KAF2010109.1 FAD dependent oxidoreductase [Aaosphaeria arxii CBS 175.79]